jgi:hypothetical protein
MYQAQAAQAEANAEDGAEGDGAEGDDTSPAAADGADEEEVVEADYEIVE